jgi:hypothetical protein
MQRCAEDRLTEHEMRGCNAGKGSEELRGDISRHPSPRQTTLRGIRQRYRWIQMRPGNRTEGKNERHQHRAGCERIGEQGKRNVAPGEAFAHDARPNHSGEKKGGADNSATMGGPMRVFILPRCGRFLS